MNKTFNTNGYCDPDIHYMVDLTERIKAIGDMVDGEKYFTINRARQYGKTTILAALADYLKHRYEVISLDFQFISKADFETEQRFVAAFARELLEYTEDIPYPVKKKLKIFALGSDQEITLSVMFKALSEWCKLSERKLVLIIDEVDTASNNQVFLDFLAQLRAYYLKRRRTITFQSVILAGVYDVRNMKDKIRKDEEHRQNSPWNIAADFDIRMSFSISDIAGMLEQYEKEHLTGMNVEEISELLFEYTSGYPFLVSRLCKLIDERLAGSKEFQNQRSVWTKPGVLEAVKLLLSEKNALFDSLINKLKDYPKLKDMLYLLLFQGQAIAYNPDDTVTDMLIMLGFVKAERDTVEIANRIFETRLYNYFLTLPEVQDGDMYKLALRNKTQFILDGQLNMEKILEKFVVHFDDIYGDQDKKFVEEDGRRYFMLYLKPIINGMGNYYVESLKI